MTLKELRMWHWRQWMAIREQINRTPLQHRATVEWENRPALQIHVAAVQRLNDHVPGTAEADCAAEDNKE